MGELAEIKTKETDSSVEAIIKGLPGEQKRKDSFRLLQLIQKDIKGKARNVG